MGVWPSLQLQLVAGEGPGPWTSLRHRGRVDVITPEITLAPLGETAKGGQGFCVVI